MNRLQIAIEARNEHDIRDLIRMAVATAHGDDELRRSASGMPSPHRAAHDEGHSDLRRLIARLVDGILNGSEEDIREGMRLVEAMEVQERAVHAPSGEA